MLYDMANTIFSMNIVSLYFPLFTLNVLNGGDVHYGIATGLSMAAIFMLSPLIGALSDNSSRRMPFLAVSTAACVTLTLFLGTGGLLHSLVIFAFANFFYQAGLQFYDSLLPVVSDETNRGRVGGVGVMVGYVGSFIGIAAGGVLLQNVDLLPLLRQQESYTLLFRVTAAAFLLLSLPCFILVKEIPRTDRRFGPGTAAAALRSVIATFRSMRSYPSLGRFLIGRIFYTDAVNTVIIFMGIYVTKEAGFTAAETGKVFIAAIFFAALGGGIWGLVVDRKGPKVSLNLMLYLWMAALLWAAAAGFFGFGKGAFWPIPCLAGFALGGTWAADRPFLLLLSPPEKIGEFYGLYGMAGRFSAVAGPLLWVLVADVLRMGRPAAVAVLAVNVAIAYFILRPVEAKPTSFQEAPLKPG